VSGLKYPSRVLFTSRGPVLETQRHALGCSSLYTLPLQAAEVQVSAHVNRACCKAKRPDTGIETTETSSIDFMTMALAGSSDTRARRRRSWRPTVRRGSSSGPTPTLRTKKGAPVPKSTFLRQRPVALSTCAAEPHMCPVVHPVLEHSGTRSKSVARHCRFAYKV